MFQYKIENNVVTITGYTDRTVKSIIIPEIIEGNRVIKIGDFSFYKFKQLIDVIIPDSITIIGHVSFYGCTSLTKIKIPNSITFIDAYALHKCSSLKEYELINNRFIRHKQLIHEIKYQICDDYVVIFNINQTLFFTQNNLYDPFFDKW